MVGKLCLSKTSLIDIRVKKNEEVSPPRDGLLQWNPRTSRKSKVRTSSPRLEHCGLLWSHRQTYISILCRSRFILFIINNNLQVTHWRIEHQLEPQRYITELFTLRSTANFTLKTNFTLRSTARVLPDKPLQKRKGCSVNFSGSRPGPSSKSLRFHGFSRH